MKSQNDYDAAVCGCTRALGKQGAKALLFFFVGLPAVAVFIAFSFAYGPAFFVPACLILATGLWLRKRLRARAS